MIRSSFAYLIIIFCIISPAPAQPVAEATLRQFIEERLRDRASSRRFRFDDFCPVDSNAVAARVFKEYGSVFAASDEVTVPSRCVFSSEQEVAKFQVSLEIKTARIGGFEIGLQEEAMEALLDAVRQAEERGLRITPLDGAVAGRRNFADAVRIWNSRFIPALNFWVARGRITREDADAVLEMPVNEQTAQVFAWESRGLYFSTSRNRPIILSVAPPGTSQHLSLLAFDIEQAGNRTVREILNRNGWYQTVLGDSPHFTYLGVPESKLPGRGLKRIVSGGHVYWIPRISAEPGVPPSAVRPN